MSEWRAVAETVLGWSLVHALWQTTVLALLFAAWRGLARRSSVARRHDVALAALAVAVLAAGWSVWMLGRERPAEDPSVIFTSASDSAAPIATAASTTLNALASRGLPAVEVRGFLRVIVLLWSLGVLALLLRLLGGLVLAARIRRHALPIVSAELAGARDRLARRLGTTGTVELLHSEDVAAPVTMGWRRPAVLFPSAMAEPLDEARCLPLLAHELAHVRAGDYPVNLVQTAIDALFFFCPGAGWLSAQVRELREYRCDDRAADLCESRILYARALAALVEPHHQPFAAQAAAGPRLADRIRRLSKGETMPPSRVMFTSGLVTSVAAVSIAGSLLVPISLRHTERLQVSRQSRQVSTDAVATGSQSGRGFTSCALDASLPQPWAPLASDALPRPTPVAPEAPGASFQCSPLLLDGKPVRGKSFSFETRGRLELVEGDPRDRDASRVAFRVWLRREGQVLFDKQAAADRGVDLGDVLAQAKPGDQLVIDPLSMHDAWARRVIVLRPAGC